MRDCNVPDCVISSADEDTARDGLCKQQHALAVGGEFYRLDGFLEVKVMEHNPALEVHEESSAVYAYAVQGKTRTRPTYDAPSSTLTRILASGLSAITAMFLRFSKGNVYDLLLVQGHSQYSSK